MVLLAFVIYIDGGLRAHKTNICLAGKNGCHGFVGAGSVHQFDFNSFVFKVAFIHGDILRSIENGMRHFPQSYL